MTSISPETIYEQCCEEFRSLNGYFWQIPLIMMTLNGGLWYSVASLELSVSAQRGILWFAVVANGIMVVGLWRLRSVMQDLLERIHEFEGRTPTETRRVIQLLFSLLLGLAALGAGIASCDPRSYFPKAEKAEKSEVIEKIEKAAPVKSEPTEKAAATRKLAPS